MYDNPSKAPNANTTAETLPHLGGKVHPDNGNDRVGNALGSISSAGDLPMDTSGGDVCQTHSLTGHRDSTGLWVPASPNMSLVTQRLEHHAGTLLTLQPSAAFQHALAQLPPEAFRLSRMQYIIGFDIESVTPDTCVTSPPLFRQGEYPTIPPPAPKRIQSYQFTTVVCESAEVRQGIFLPHEGKRLSLGEMLHIAIQYGPPLPRHRRPRTRKGNSHAKPLRVLLCWHWGSAEVDALRDREKLMAHPHVICLGGAIATTTPVIFSTRTNTSRNTRALHLTLRDSILLMDGRTPLADIGEVLQLEKLKLGDGEIAHMDILLRDDPQRFINYAIRDTEITLLWILHCADIAYNTGLNTAHSMTKPTMKPKRKVPITAGSLVADGLQQYYANHAINHEERHGLQRSKDKKKWEPQFVRKNHESFVISCYVGGTNQTYELWEQYGLITDHDLDGAYPTMFGLLPCIDFSRPPLMTQNVTLTSLEGAENYIGIYDFAYGHFTFPQGTRFPCIPVRDKDHGLIYPLSNADSTVETPIKAAVHMCGPEIKLALSMGATIHIIEARHFYTLPELLCCEYDKKLIALRYATEKGTPENLAYKLMLVSQYGKYGQGTGIKVTYKDLLGDEHEATTDIPYCKITLPHVAAAITSTIRATLNVVIQTVTSLTGTVLSATTDGVMVRQPMSLPGAEDTTAKQFNDKINAHLASHPCIQPLIEARKRLEMKLPEELVELKSYDDPTWIQPDNDPDAKAPKITWGTSAYTWKTRMYEMQHGGKTLHKARTSYTSNIHRHDHIASADLIARTHSNDTYYHLVHRLRNVESAIKHDLDVNSYDTIALVNLAPDWKRVFYPDGTSRPYTDITEYKHFRVVVDQLKNLATPERVLRTIAQNSSEKIRLPSAKQQKIALALRMAHDIPGYRLPADITPKQAMQALGYTNIRQWQRLKLAPLTLDDFYPDSECKRLMKELRLH
jgi:hypothetical protein